MSKRWQTWANTIKYTVHRNFHVAKFLRILRIEAVAKISRKNLCRHLVGVVIVGRGILLS